MINIVKLYFVNNNIHLSNHILVVGPSLKAPTPSSYPFERLLPLLVINNTAGAPLPPVSAPHLPPSATLWGHHHLVRLPGFGKGDCGGPTGSTAAPCRSLLHRPRRQISLLPSNVHVVTGETRAGAQSQSQGGSSDQVDLEVN